jgi:hypothetical protein
LINFVVLVGFTLTLPLEAGPGHHFRGDELNEAIGLLTSGLIVR